MMRCLLQEKEIAMDSWPSLLPQVGYSLNSIPNASTGFTPYRIMFGVDPKPLSLAALGAETQDCNYSVLEWVKEMEHMGGCVKEEVEENLEIARGRMKRAYDRGKTESKVSAGDLVLLRKHNRKSGLEQCYKGPYSVLSRKGPNVLINQDSKGRNIEKWVHLNQCKRFTPHITSDYSTVGNVGAHMYPQTEIRDSPEYPTANDEYEPDTPDESEPSNRETTLVPVRRSGRIRKPSKKLLEAQWSEELSDDSENGTHGRGSDVID